MYKYIYIYIDALLIDFWSKLTDFVSFIFTFFLSRTSHPTNDTRRNHTSIIFQFSIKAQKSFKINLSIFFPLEGNFDIDARDGGGPFRTPKNPPKLQKPKNIFRTKIVHTSGHFFQKSQKTSLKYVHIHRKRYKIR